MKFLFPSILLLFPGFILAQNWRGTVDSNWNNPANWSAWPLNGADISINPANYTGASQHPVISANSVFSPAAVLVTNNGQLTIAANLTTTDDVECTGAGSGITVNAGTFSVNPGDGGRLIIDLGATLLLNNGNIVVDERFIAGEDATVTIEGGTASSGERLLMDLGGQFHQNGGSVSVSAVFAIADGSANRSSGYILNNGNLTVNGEFGIETETGNFFPFFEQNGGTCTVNAPVSWLGSAPGGGRGYFRINNGVANVNGAMENTAGSTLNMQIELHNNGMLNLIAPLMHLLLPADSLLQTESSQLTILSNTLLQNAGVVLCSSGTVLLNANLDFQDTGSFQLDDVIISANRTLTHSTASDIRISGDLLLNGSYLAQNHRLILNGADQQEISGQQQFNPYSLTIANSSAAGVQLSVNAVLNGDFSLVNGKLHTSSVSMLKLTSTATSNLGNQQSFVWGPMEKAGNTAYVFPIGKNGRWARAGISAPAAVTDVFRAEYFDIAYPSLSPVSSPLSAASGIEYWSILPSSGNSQVAVSLYWEDAAASAITDCGELSIARWSSTSWENVLSVPSGICTANGAGSTLSSSALSAYGDFTFGFYSGVTTQAVQLCGGDTLAVGQSSYTASGTYIDVLQDLSMNDSIVITQLEIVVPNIAFTFAGSTLTAEAGSPQSIAWIDCEQSVTVGTSAAFTPLQSGSYALTVTENGCTGSTDCFYFTYADTAICAGTALDFAGMQITAPGSYSGALAASGGEDSLISLLVGVTAINTLISYYDTAIFSQNTTAEAYAWMNCDSMTIVPDISGPVLSGVYPGSYAVIISENGCVDTSDCASLSLLGTEESAVVSAVKFFPNPSAGEMTVSAGENGVLTVCSASGQVLFRENLSAGVSQVINPGAGAYIAEFIAEDGTRHIGHLIFR